MTPITPNIKPSDARRIKARWVITASLEFITPVAIGNGIDGDLVDRLIQRDSETGHFFITGETIAGVLRSYLNDRIRGFETREFDLDANDNLQELTDAMVLFGSPSGLGVTQDGKEQEVQSPLIVFDALPVMPAQPAVQQNKNPMAGLSVGIMAQGMAKNVQPVTQSSSIELRDGIRLTENTGVVERGAKFDFETAAVGTKLPIRFELLIHEPMQNQAPELEALSDEPRLLKALATALYGLGFRNNSEGGIGEIRFGAWTRKGLGEIKTSSWQAKRFDLSIPAGLLDWLKSSHEKPPEKVKTQKDVWKEFEQIKDDKREQLCITLNLTQKGALLIAGGEGIADANQLLSNNKPVLSGRSVNGAIRSRALRIANTISSKTGKTFVEQMFGLKPDGSKNQKLKASKVSVSESLFQNPKQFVQSRIAIDPFTQAPVDSALFDETPVWNSTVKLTIKLQKPNNAEKGLLLLVLRDLILEDLVIGGTGNIGRGRFTGNITVIDGGVTYPNGSSNPNPVFYDWIKELNTQLGGQT